MKKKTYIILSLLPIALFFFYYAVVVPLSLSAPGTPAIGIGVFIGLILFLCVPIYLIFESVRMIRAKKLRAYAVIVIILNVLWLGLMALGMTVGQSV